MTDTSWRRLVEWGHQLFVAIDQLAQVLVSGPKYLAVGGEMTADETISSKVGRMARLGHRWAILAAWIIDRLFWPFNGHQLSHCDRAIEQSLILAGVVGAAIRQLELK